MGGICWNMGTCRGMGCEVMGLGHGDMEMWGVGHGDVWDMGSCRGMGCEAMG